MRVKRLAAQTLFQPEAPDVPIQVLGVLESAGLEFDHLWVMGLTDEAWPIPARPNPFIPVALQRAAGHSGRKQFRRFCFLVDRNPAFSNGDASVP